MPFLVIDGPARNFVSAAGIVGADNFGVVMKINRGTEDRYLMQRDHRAAAADWISWTGSTPSSYSPSNTSSISSSTSATTSEGRQAPVD
jgi:hypothetical protein